MKNGHKLKEVTGEGPGGVNGVAGDMTAERARIDLLVLNLAMIVGRPVFDRTGLTGAYDFKLKYALELGSAAKGPAVPDDKPALPAASDPIGPSIFEALQDQLGLK